MTLQNHLTALASSGLIHLAQLEPELEYLFRHALTQDATYQSLLKTDCQTLHQRVGQVLEKLYPDQEEFIRQPGLEIKYFCCEAHV